MTETCEECGFDSRSWRVADAATVLHALGLWWRLATDGIDADQLNRRPAPTVWSALEYGVHSALVTALLRAGTEMIHAEDGVSLPVVTGSDASADEAGAVLDRDAVVADLEREGMAYVDLIRAAPKDAWSHAAQLPDSTLTAEAAVLHAAHDATHHHMDVGRGLAALGAGVPRHEGGVSQVNASGGGVPKLPVDGGHIDHAGLEGDRQADRKHHGRPFQALCLWSAEVIAELASLGHPIAPGCAGENITLSGVDWAALRPGARLRIGSALAEISYPAVPSAKQARWFSDGDFGRIAHENNPDWVRWYAWVREPGDVHTGDAVVVQP